MSATVTGWRRRGPGQYDRGLWSVRREPDPRRPDRPWVLYRASLTPGKPDRRGAFHTLKLAKLAAR